MGSSDGLLSVTVSLDPILQVYKQEETVISVI